MARDLKLRTNVDPVSADYPDGRIRNDPGDGTGTPVEEAINGDLIQFFQKAMRDAGITANDLPDNTTNGWQLNDAVNLAAKLFDNEYGWTSAGLTFGTNISDSSGYPVQYRKIGNKVEWRGIAEGTPAVTSGADILSAIPASLVPSESKHQSVGLGQGGSRVASIQPTGTVMKLWFDVAGTSISINFDGVSYYV